MKINFKHALPVAAILLCSGCASIVNGTNQPVSIETRLNGAQVAGANCTLVNNKGTWYVTTPGSVTIHRSMEDLNVKCEKEAVQPGTAAVKSHTKGMAFGNILFGGVIGAGVDIANGSAFDYPTLIQVKMGEAIVIAPHATQTVAENTNTVATSTTLDKTSAPLK